MKTLKLFMVIILIFVVLGCSCHTPMVPMFSGDCVDRAVKIRQELRAKGYEADLILGIAKIEGSKKGHMWIRYRKNRSEQWRYIRNL